MPEFSVFSIYPHTHVDKKKKKGANAVLEVSVRAEAQLGDGCSHPAVAGILRDSLGTPPTRIWGLCRLEPGLQRFPGAWKGE